MKHLLLSILTGIILIACNSNKQTKEKPLIVCTTSIIGNTVSDLVDSNIVVKSLMGPGVDPHLYKVTQGDLQLLTNADIIIYNGLHLEGKMVEILDKIGRQKTVLAIADGIDSSQFINTSGFVGGIDPHIWFDVELWVSGTRYLAKELEKHIPQQASQLQKNCQLLTQKYIDVHHWTINQIKRIPEQRKVLVTAHDAFGYFSRAYNLPVKPLQGISTVSEYGLKDVLEMVNFLIEKDIPAVFVESSVSDKSLKAVIEGCSEKGHKVKIGGALFSDAMGEKGTPKGTYVGMIQHNVSTIVSGLSND